MKQVCAEPGCPWPVTYRGRCRIHARQRERETHRNRHIYGSAKWRHTRKRYLFDHPTCERCGVVATDVHHKRGVEADPWSLDGLEALCVACHSRLTRQEQIG